MEDKFRNIIKEHSTTLEKDNRAFNIMGYAKIIALAYLAFWVYRLVAIRGSSPDIFQAISTTLMFISAIAFLISLWGGHSYLHKKIDYKNGIIKICNQHLARISGSWAEFKDTGAEFADTAHPYACDLDIAGEKSLFQFLNTTHTWYGRQSFANALLRCAFTPEEIQKRQEAIAELSQNIELTNKMQYLLSQIGINPQDVKLAEELSDATPFMRNKPLKFLLSYVPVLTIILLFVGFFFQQTTPLIAGGVFAAGQLLAGLAGWLQASKYLGVMNRLPYKLGRYVSAIEAITAENFTSDELNRLKSQLGEASEAVKALNRIVNMLSIRHNALIYFALNILLLWDYHCAFLLEEWKKKYSANAGAWLKSMGEFESLVAFSHLPNVCGNTCIPLISNVQKTITAQSLGHPLISNAARVNNDLSFRDNIFIISGSNMSGKTTFMRTVGINLVLAKAGSFVCAQQMQASCMPVITSMRIGDDLVKGFSTFYAELTRIKGIIDLAGQNPNMLFLIDEIFRGTNSVDRLAGAEAVIAKLNALGASGMISTHDLELCKLAAGREQDRLQNHSFSENYENGNISFGYKMKPGQSQTTNAKYLMKMVGITT